MAHIGTDRLEGEAPRREEWLVNGLSPLEISSDTKDEDPNHLEIFLCSKSYC